MPFVINSNSVSELLAKSTAKKLNPLKKVPRFKTSTAEEVVPVTRNHKINDLHLITIDPRRSSVCGRKKQTVSVRASFLDSNARGFF